MVAPAAHGSPAGAGCRCREAAECGGVGVEPGRGHVADLELERLEAAERATRQAGDDVDAVALVDRLGEVRPAEGDAVEDVEPAAEGQLAVAAAGGPRTRVTVSPRTATSGSGLPMPHGARRGRSRCSG